MPFFRFIPEFLNMGLGSKQPYLALRNLQTENRLNDLTSICSQMARIVSDL